jgi:ATP-binding protein involved in chromosome partitioning
MYEKMQKLQARIPIPKRTMRKILQRFKRQSPKITGDIPAMETAILAAGLLQPGEIRHLALTGGQLRLIVEIQTEKLSGHPHFERELRDWFQAHTIFAEPQIIITAHRPSPASPKTPNPYADRGPLWGIRNVKKIIAVASGKGGVGKSTTAVNLAVALAQNGQSKIGLLDCDIYGPSIPTMLGVHARPEITADKKMLPLEKHGLKLMSMGFLVDANNANIWRGPMVMGAVTQMLGDVDWGDLDILVVDLPPGTGDAQLTLSQRAPLAGAIIVSTPQDIALIDARKAVAMFQKIHVPILGLIENMSYFDCPNCHHRSEIFAHGGAREEAYKIGVPFLGEIPLDIAIRRAADQGLPLAIRDSNFNNYYRPLAASVQARLFHD